MHEQHNNQQDFVWQTEQFADIRILRYRIEGFEQLSVREKTFAYYLYRAALEGRDIIYDQNYRYNLLIRRTLEAIIIHFEGNRTTDEWNAFIEYTKRVWFSNGVHHHYSTEKFLPGFSKEYFRSLLGAISRVHLPVPHNMDIEAFPDLLIKLMFDPAIDFKRVNQTSGDDLVLTSACNYYEGMNQLEAEEFYRSVSNPDNSQPVSVGLNSKLVKKDGLVVEQYYFSDGMYGKAIRRIVMWLSKARPFACSVLQQQSLDKLIEFYETGDLKSFDEYSVLWVKDSESVIDFVNGFIEVYGDPLGYHGAWQSMVYMRDEQATVQFAKISSLAGWFEAKLPIDDRFRRQVVEGVSFRVVQVIVESGDNSPSSPIGVNLPNADWIRAKHGSKSISLGNIEDAYDMASKQNGTLEEFYLPDQQERIRAFGSKASKLHTALHEVIGHGSGQLLSGVATPKETLKSYSNTIEEARADLVALYFIYDDKLLEQGIVDSSETGKAAYDSFMVGGLLRQLVRIEAGQQLEEAHMRNRQLIASWAYEQGKANKIVQLLKIQDKTYVQINDYEALRTLFGQLLALMQHIKSTGDYQAAAQLVETYGVKVDRTIHDEVLGRWRKLGIAPFAGFINPVLKAEMHEQIIRDVVVEYPDDFTGQMMHYASVCVSLPILND